MNVIDHGSVEMVESWGSDEHVIRAARQSTDGAFRGWSHKCEHCGGRGYRDCSEMGQPGITTVMCDQCDGQPYVPGDEKLLRYLYLHRHMTPFEMAGAIFEVKAPIFVFREWHRHRTQSYNEMSARYIPIPDENYQPTVDRCLMVNASNKQANRADGAKALTHDQALTWLEMLERSYRVSQEVYQYGLDIGIPKEIARVPLPVGRYSKMWASANLRNWLQFLSLRNDGAAQWEIQEYARAVQTLLTERFPRTLALFEEER